MSSLVLNTVCNDVFNTETLRRSCIYKAQPVPLLKQEYGKNSILSLNRNLIKCSALKGKAPPRDPVSELEGEALSNWEDSVEFLSQELSLEKTESSKIIGRAFGWVLRGYWGDEVVDVVPTKDKLADTLEFLRSLGFESPEISNLIKMFPYALALDVEKRMKKNIEQMDRDWGISGAAVKRSILRKPEVLGYTLDCKGDCIAECDRCWARF